MSEAILERVVLEAVYYVENKTTIRDVAKKFNISKTTVHNDFVTILKNIDIDLFNKVKSIIEYNKSIRHIRGGESTKNRYNKKKKTI